MPENNSNQQPAKPAAPESNPIGEELDLFVKQIDGLAATLPLANLVIHAAIDTAAREFNTFLHQECKKIDSNTYTVEAAKHFQYRRLKGRLQRTQLAHDLVPRSFLVSLVSQFDAFLGGLIRQLFRIKPEILNSSTNMLTFSQMVEFGSIERAKQYIIDKEIESVLRKSHSEQFDWLENKFGVCLRVDLPAWPVFVEVTERRNLFVHSDGIVSHQYLEICRRHSSPVDSDVCPGQRLSLTRQYFESAHECLLEIGVKLAQVLWRKLQPDDLVKADESLITVCYELLAEGRYGLARRLLDFGTETLKKHSTEASRLTMVVNRAQGYKWSGDDASAKKIIHAEDWSAAEPKFRLAEAVLLDEFPKAVEIMTQIGEASGLTKLSYREWPLFKEIRKSPEFAAAFEKIFKEPLNAVTVDDKNISPPRTVH